MGVEGSIASLESLDLLGLDWAIARIYGVNGLVFGAGGLVK